MCDFFRTKNRGWRSELKSLALLDWKSQPHSNPTNLARIAMLGLLGARGASCTSFSSFSLRTFATVTRPALQAADAVEQPAKRRHRGRNLYEFVQSLPENGLGYNIRPADWRDKPGCYYTLTDLKLKEFNEVSSLRHGLEDVSGSVLIIKSLVFVLRN
jgi:hypothetical protein